MGRQRGAIIRRGKTYYVKYRTPSGKQKFDCAPSIDSTFRQDDIAGNRLRPGSELRERVGQGDPGQNPAQCDRLFACNVGWQKGCERREARVLAA